MSLLLVGTAKASLIVVAALAITALLRRRSAAVRHGVLAAALLCAAAAPALERVAPSWHITWSAPRSTTWILEPVGRITAAADVEAGRPDASGAAEARKGTSYTIDAGLLVGLWAAGFVISLLMLVIALARLGWLARRARPVVDGVWPELAAEAAAAYGVRRPVRLLQSEHPAMLATWGLFRPRIILPMSAGEWPPDRVRVVLYHELAHVRRGDWTVQLGADMLRAVQWFNPLVWVACRRLRQESEQACDDLVLNSGVEGTCYATHLLDLARTFTGHGTTWFPTSPAPAIARPSSLEGRIVAMLNARLNRSPIRRPAAAAIVTAVLVATVAVAGFGAAQTVFGTLSGTVSDQMGRAVPDVALELTNVRNASKYEVKSDGTGRFEFIGLPAGDYSLASRIPGFMTTQDKFTLGGQDAQRNVGLVIGEIEETIRVMDSDTPPVASQSDPAKRMMREGKPDRCSTLTVGGCILAPVKVRDVHPYYPTSLAASGVEGRVLLVAQIGTDGLVSDVRAVKPAPADLVAAAILAVSQWEFAPTHLDGFPIDTQMNVTVNFARRK
jgi:TonB family protein